MSITLITFYLFSAVLLLSSLMVISTKNPVHSVLFLILAFLNAAGIFVILHAEFLAMILIIVYVGAVAVLFLFVVMMLDFKTSLEKDNILQYMPIGLLIGLVFIAELVIVLINTRLDLSNQFLILSALLFSIGVIGIFLNRKNVIIILMSIEIILLAVNINLVSFSYFLNDLTGQIFSLFVLTVAAAEAAIGLAILVIYNRNAGSIEIEKINTLKG